MHDGSANRHFHLLGSRLEEIALRHGNLLAIGDKQRPILRFSELVQRMRSIRALVAEAGVPAGARVAVWMKNRADAAIWITALCESCECLPLVPSMTAASVQAAFETLKPVALITDGTDGPICSSAMISTNATRLVVSTKTGEWFWTLEGRIGKASLPYPEAKPDDVALYLMTSGSTGAPKIVPVSHQAIALTTQRAADALELVPGETTLNMMQLNHVHGLVSGVFLPWSAAGCTMMPGEYSAKTFLDWYRAIQPNWFSTSPAIYRDILRRATASGTPLVHEGLRFVRSGSAALDTALRRQIEAAFAVPLVEAYGMSETLQIAGGVVADPRPNTVGRPIADEVGIFERDTRLTCAGKVGEICIRGRTVMPHYIGDPERKLGFRDGWFRTGDIGHFDVDGFLHVSGRLGDQVNVGGEIIAPAEIEAALTGIDGIESCVCFGEKHHGLDETLSCAVVLEPGASLDGDDIRREALAVLPAIKVPGRVYVVDVIPVGPNGKINRREIADGLSVKATSGGAKPHGALEGWLTGCFRRVLKEDAIDAESNFFDLGGTSLDTMELLLEIEGRIGETIHVPVLFNAPTVRKLAKYLRQEYPKAAARMERQAEAPPIGSSGSDLNELRSAFRASLPNFKATPLTTTSSSTSPLFILSAPRCGSTLLRVMLAGHKQVFSPPEMRLLGFHNLQQWAENHDGPFRFFRDGLVQALMTAENWFEPAAREWLSRKASQKMPVEHVYDHLQRRLGNRIIVDKTPLYALSKGTLKSIANRFAAPRYLVLYRNPYEMKRSYIKARMHQAWMYGGNWDPGTLAELIWSETYANIEAVAKTLEPRRVMRLHFEDLVSDPSGVMTRVCGFAGIPFDPAVLDPYEDQGQRMTAGLSAGANMIGDPRFMHHGFIDSTRAGFGLTLPEFSGLSKGCQDLATGIGYAHPDGSLSEPETIRNQALMVRDWGQRSELVDDLIYACNRKGSKPPIFWVSQQENESTRLAHALGEDQPLYFMRSGHLIVGRYDRGVVDLAQKYVSGIEKIYPEGPLVLGGNCQGADVSREMCRLFAARNRPASLFVAIDLDTPGPLDVPTAHIFGSESHRNPFRNGGDPRPSWDTLYRNYSVDFMPCAHGQYFTESALPVLKQLVTHRIAMAFAQS